MNEEPLDDQITVLDYSSMLYDVRRQRNELRAEFNIVIKQLEDMEHQRDKYKKQWRDAVDALATFILITDAKP
jgi:hypothetical protein